MRLTGIQKQEIERAIESRENGIRKGVYGNGYYVGKQRKKIRKLREKLEQG